MAAVLWWVQIGVDVRVEVQIRVARVVGFGYGFVAVLWWVLAAVCAVGFFFFWWWLVVVAVAVAVVRGDELEKLRPWRF